MAEPTKEVKKIDDNNIEIKLTQTQQINKQNILRDLGKLAEQKEGLQKQLAQTDNMINELQEMLIHFN